MRQAEREQKVSGETQARLEAADLYGSWEHYRAKERLNEEDREVSESYLAALKAYAGQEGSQDPEEPQGPRPAWADPFLLRTLPLALLGAPDTSAEYEASKATTSPKMERAALLPSLGLELRYEDYRELGWPRSSGRSARLVTPEEDREIRFRLASAGLTKPGAEVLTIGKTLAEMVSENEPTPPWLIEGILRRGGAAMIYGPTGIGKTFLTHTMLLLVAAGQGAGVQGGPDDQWLLRAGEHKGAKVCLVDGEMIVPDITSRMKGLALGMGMRAVGGTTGEDDTESNVALLRDELEAEPIVSPLGPIDALGPEVQENLRTRRAGEIERAVEAYRQAREFQAMPGGPGAGVAVNFDDISVYAKTAQDVRAGFADLADPEGRTAIVGFAKEQALDLIVFDNVSTLSPSLEDENSSANWNPLNDLIVALKKEGVAVLLIHHSNKGNTGYRGSTNLATTLETVIKLSRPESQIGHEGAAMKLDLEKDRSGGRHTLNGKVLKLQGMQWVYDEDPHDSVELVVQAAKSLRYRTQGDVAKALDKNQATVSRSLQVAVAKNLCTESEWRQWFRKAKALQAMPVGDLEEDDEDVGTLDI